MNKYPHKMSRSQKENLREAMLEQAEANIREDGDRVEKLIEENTDIIQELYYQTVNIEDSAISQMAKDHSLGKLIRELIERKITYLAEDDVDKELSE